MPHGMAWCTYVGMREDRGRRSSVFNGVVESIIHTTYFIIEFDSSKPILMSAVSPPPTTFCNLKQLVTGPPGFILGCTSRITVWSYASQRESNHVYCFFFTWNWHQCIRISRLPQRTLQMLLTHSMCSWFVSTSQLNSSNSSGPLNSHS